MTGEMGSGAGGTDRRESAFGAVVAVCDAGFALGGSVEPDVGGALKATSKEEKSLECLCGRGSADDGKDHGSGLLACALLWLGGPVWGAMEDGAWVEVLYLFQDELVSLVSVGCGGGDVVDDHRDHKFLFLVAGGRWDKGADDFLKFESGLEELVCGGVGGCDLLEMMVLCEANFSDDRFG